MLTITITAANGQAARCGICNRTRPAHDHAESIVAPEHRHEWAPEDEDRRRTPAAGGALKRLTGLTGRPHNNEHS